MIVDRSATREFDESPGIAAFIECEAWAKQRQRYAVHGKCDRSRHALLTVIYLSQQSNALQSKTRGRRRPTHSNITRALLTKYFHKTEPNAPDSPPPPSPSPRQNQFSECRAAPRNGRFVGSRHVALCYEKTSFVPKPNQCCELLSVYPVRLCRFKL